MHELEIPYVALISPCIGSWKRRQQQQLEIVKLVVENEGKRGIKVQERRVKA